MHNEHIVNESVSQLPEWLVQKIKHQQVFLVNTAHPRWQDRLAFSFPRKKRVHLAGLGDVGSTLLTGLRLLGKDDIDCIGIFDLSESKLQRWINETNQIGDLNFPDYPPVLPLTEPQLFNCDLFIFCIARQVPGLEVKKTDVRMAQFDANRIIIEEYALKARAAKYQGIFAVVSDPVDQLCVAAYRKSNEDANGNYDGEGLIPEQVKGFGLGVMNARAHFYAKQHPDTIHFNQEGRVFGPHGQGLIVADSIDHFDPALSDLLTSQTLSANLVIREIGFKPFVAPALSSGCLPLLATLRGEWHYSTVFIGGVYFGCRNRWLTYGQEWETLIFPDALYQRLQDTYARLEQFPC
ncbi:lactate dehydrogenase [Anoxynatronum sibiricum]|uniref:lactate dehydrogenase n=1 Tax=Anoxynatronum sibiricum TaxID=210623 RepID=UPI0031B89AAB